MRIADLKSQISDGIAKDPCQLAWQVDQIGSYHSGIAKPQDPCQLAWQVNKIEGYGGVSPIRRVLLRDDSRQSSSPLRQAQGGRKPSRIHFSSHQSYSPTWQARGGLADGTPPASRPLLRSGARPVPATLRRGMTLVELLVVIFIILLVAAIMLPRLQPIMDHGKIREAARAIQLYLSSARNQAIVSGRSCGVLIEPLPADNGCSMTLKQVETPAAYGGDFLGATAALIYTGTSQSANGGVIASCLINLSPNPHSPTPASIPINVGDLVQVGYQGFLLNVVSPPSNPSLTVYNPPVNLFYANIDIGHGETPFWLSQQVNVPGPALPYKIWRWPVKSGAGDMQLPSPTVIDLTWSGNDPVGSVGSPTWTIQTPPATAPALPTPVIIMFAADGRIDWVSNYGSPGGQPATTPIYLLVGMRNKVFDNHTDPNIANTNLNDFNSLWVSIDAATGLIVVADPAAVGTTTAVLPAPPTNSDSRAFARQAIVNLGGK